MNKISKIEILYTFVQKNAKISLMKQSADGSVKLDKKWHALDNGSSYHNASHSMDLIG
ncbi:MAG: hypothetical protein Q4A29_01625 [Eubacteriales bacterium]|nr:hypothetical protein [Eubacteriales bacterium]